MSRVLVTGASGFLASHIVKQLLDSGEYIVRGTVRSLKNEQKVRPLKNLCPNAKHELELVEADLLNKESWVDAVKDCTYVLHVASPFPATNPRDEMELIRPAVDGTTNVLEACAKTKGVVKRVVVTSSGVAVYGGRVGEDHVFTEEDWSVEERCSPYLKSKYLAEKAAWDFVQKLADDEKFELSVINPLLIIGPVLKGTSCTSMEFHRRLLQREMPMVPRLSIGICDVRDVAAAHIAAMTLPQAAGNRYIACTESIWVSDMARILDEEFGPQGYNVPTKTAPMWLIKVVSWFDGSMKMLLPELDHEVKFSNAKIKADLGYKPVNIKDTINDMGYSLIESGFVKKTAKYHGKDGASGKEAASP